MCDVALCPGMSPLEIVVGVVGCEHLQAVVRVSCSLARASILLAFEVVHPFESGDEVVESFHNCVSWSSHGLSNVFVFKVNGVL